MDSFFGGEGGFHFGTHIGLFFDGIPHGGDGCLFIRDIIRYQYIRFLSYYHFTNNISNLLFVNAMNIKKIFRSSQTERPQFRKSLAMGDQSQLSLAPEYSPV